MARAIDEQIGGKHYKNLPIQPIEYIFKNGLGFAEGNVVKYVTRYSQKGGVDDLKKARHYLDLLIEHIEGEKECEPPLLTAAMGTVDAKQAFAPFVPSRDAKPSKS